MAHCRGKLFAAASLAGRCRAMNARRLSYATFQHLSTKPEGVTYQQTRSAGGNRDYRIETIDFSWQKQGRAAVHLMIILLKNDPNLGTAFRVVSVPRPLARKMILHQAAAYYNTATKKKYRRLLKYGDAGVSVDEVREWFLDNFRLPALIPHNEDFAFYASDIQAAIRQCGMHVPLQHIFLEKPLTTYGEHRVAIAIPGSVGEDGKETTEQISMLATVMPEAEAQTIYKIRQGVDTAEIGDDEDFELTGEVVNQYTTLRSSRKRLRQQMEDDRVIRINELRFRKGLPPLPLPSEIAARNAEQEQESNQERPANSDLVAL